MKKLIVDIFTCGALIFGVYGLYRWFNYQEELGTKKANSFINDCHSRGGIVTPSSGFFSIVYVCNPK